MDKRKDSKRPKKPVVVQRRQTGEPVDLFEDHEWGSDTVGNPDMVPTLKDMPAYNPPR